MTATPSFRVGDLGVGDLRAKLRNPGLALEIGPVTLRIRAPITQVSDLIGLLYRDYHIAQEPMLPDADIRVRTSKSPARWFRPQVQCLVDGRPPFEPMPKNLAYPMLEWAMNWSIASRLHRYFLIHAAAVEREGQAIILPAWSGSGKSTLCAALVYRGWRLLSDEFCLLGLEDLRVHPLPRPIPLKNESIAAVRRFAPDAVMGPTFYQTRKGDIAHLRPPKPSLDALRQSATPAHVVLPGYLADSGARLKPIAAGTALQLMASNSFNFNLLGAPAFDALSSLLKTVACHHIAYSDLDKAVETMESLAP